MKKKYWIPLVIVFILVITNPSGESFCYFVLSHTQYPESRVHAAKESNYLIFSKYHYTVLEKSGSYYGLAGNFFYASGWAVESLK